MGGACSTRGRKEVYTVFWRGNLWNGDQLDVDGSIILRWIFRKWDGRNELD
jgi:hypothetical protein